MLGYLKGFVIDSNKGRLLLDVQGVGYEVFVPSSYTFKAGDLAELWIHTYVREDVFNLFGFNSEREKEVFAALIGISGVGPKSAVGILSQTSDQELISWIENEDLSSLCKLPKIGKKTAQQMILSLKGKLPQQNVYEEKNNEVQKEISSALMRLGFRSAEIKSVLEKIDPQKNVKDGIYEALVILQSL